MDISVLSAALLLFLVLDPIGNIPLFLCILRKIEPRRQRRIILREVCIALGFLLAFMFLGQYLLSLLQVSQHALGIAGGIILFLIALKMIFADASEIFSSVALEGEPFLVPLAIPLVAGPSALTMVLLLMAKEPTRWLGWTLALFAAWGASSVILLLSSRLSRILGDRGLLALERLMGMLLTIVSIEMFIKGIRQAFMGG